MTTPGLEEYYIAACILNGGNSVAEGASRLLLNERTLATAVAGWSASCSYLSDEKWGVVAARTMNACNQAKEPEETDEL